MAVVILSLILIDKDNGQWISFDAHLYKLLLAASVLCAFDRNISHEFLHWSTVFTVFGKLVFVFFFKI